MANVSLYFVQQVQKFANKLNSLKSPYNEWNKIDEINQIFNEIKFFLMRNEQFLEANRNVVSKIINKIIKVKFELLNEKVMVFTENEYLMKDNFVVQAFIDNLQELQDFQVSFISYVDLCINNDYPNVFLLYSECSMPIEYNNLMFRLKLGLL